MLETKRVGVQHIQKEYNTSHKLNKIVRKHHIFLQSKHFCKMNAMNAINVYYLCKNTSPNRKRKEKEKNKKK